jgi:flagellar biosynthesis anti-sigma factor FlgM
MSDDEKHNSGDQAGPPPSWEDTGVGPDGPDQEARLIEKAREVVYQTPEVRPEKVAPLKEAIEQGTYEIDSEKLAEILVEELLGKR